MATSRQWSVVAALLLTCGVVSTALADLPGPGGRQRGRPVQPVARKEAPLEVRVEPGTEVTRLRIPKRFLPTDFNATEGAAAPIMDDGGARLRTIIAGLALSGAAVVGLMWLSGSRRRTRVVAGLAGASCLLVAGALWSNAPPPSPVPPRPGEERRIVIEVVPDGEQVVLTVAPNFLRARPAGAGAAPRPDQAPNSGAPTSPAPESAPPR